MDADETWTAGSPVDGPREAGWLRIAVLALLVVAHWALLATGLVDVDSVPPA